MSIKQFKLSAQALDLLTVSPVPDEPNAPDEPWR